MTIIPSHLSQNYIPIFTRLPHYISSRWQYRSFNQIRWLTLANLCINTPPKPLLPSRLFISPPPSPLPRPLVRPFRGRLCGSHPLVLPCNLRNCPYHLRVVPTLHDFLLPPSFVYSPIAIAERFRLVSPLLCWRGGTGAVEMSICARAEPPRGGGTLGKRKERTAVVGGAAARRRRRRCSRRCPLGPSRPGRLPPLGSSSPCRRRAAIPQGWRREQFKLMAGYLAHEFLRSGTLLGERPESNSKAPAPRRAPAGGADPARGTPRRRCC